MNLPQSEYYPDDPNQMPPARRRRARRLLAPLEADERAAFLDEMVHRTSPTFDFFLFSLLAGLILGIGILLDTPALLLLGALAGPVMAPAVGISLGTVTGSGRTFFQCLIGLLIGSLFAFGAGFLAGLVTLIWQPDSLSQAYLHAQISWPNFIVLAVGAILSAAAMVQSDHKPYLPSVALVYQLYIPLVIAGFGLSSGLTGLFPNGLVIFILHLSWAALLGAITFAILGIRPLTLFGYTLSGAVALAGIIVAIGISGMGAVLETHIGLPTSTPSSTPTLTPVPPTLTLTSTPVPPTATLTPTLTSTSTPSPTFTLTPSPTPVYAYIFATSGDPPGAKLRREPGGAVIRSYLNNTLVQVLPDTQEQGGLVWAHVIVLQDGTEGWILQSLLLIATPAPNW